MSFKTPKSDHLDLFSSGTALDGSVSDSIISFESEHLRAIVNGLVIPVVIRLESDHTAMYVNQPYRELAGIPSDIPDDKIPRGTLIGSKAWRSLDKFLETSDEVRNFEVVTTARGRKLTLVLNIRRVKFNEQWARLITAQDVTEFRVSQQEQHKLAAIVEASDEFIGLTDLVGRPRYLNAAGRELMGLQTDDDISRLQLADFCAPEDRDALRKLWRNIMRSGRYVGTFRLWHFKTREIIPTSINVFLVRDPASGVPIANAILAHDLRDQIKAEEERQELQDQILHSPEVGGLGVLAGGIAHDFNNLLMVILGNTSLALNEPTLSDPVRPFLDTVQQTTRHAADLTGQILNYAGKGHFALKPVQIATVIEEMKSFIASAITKKCSVTYSFDDTLPAVMADPAQLRQVVMNLVVNASDAIEEKGINEGKISVSLSLQEIDQARIRQDVLGFQLTPGKYVQLRVSDNGTGLKSSIQQRIFEPFFTTKFTGRGLGLASVYGIMRGIRVVSS